MTVSTEKLTRMAEQITANMNYGEDTEILATKVADHINKFWDERMKSAFKQYANQHKDNLSAELQAAVSKID
jgi:hypothetical protein